MRLPYAVVLCTTKIDFRNHQDHELGLSLIFSLGQTNSLAFVQKPDINSYNHITICTDLLGGRRRTRASREEALRVTALLAQCACPDYASRAARSPPTELLALLARSSRAPRSSLILFSVADYVADNYK